MNNIVATIKYKLKKLTKKVDKGSGQSNIEIVFGAALIAKAHTNAICMMNEQAESSLSAFCRQIEPESRLEITANVWSGSAKFGWLIMTMRVLISNCI